MTEYPWDEANQALLNVMSMAASCDNAMHGQVFLSVYIALANHLIAFDFTQGKWVIVHQNGIDHEGRPVYVENDSTVKAGLGKKNGLNIEELSDNGGAAKANQALLNAMNVAASYDNAKYGQAFLKDFLAVAKNSVALNVLKGRREAVHPNGKDHEGRPVCVENDGTVKAGLGKKNGLMFFVNINGGAAKVNQAILNAMDMAVSYDNAEHGQLFLKCFLAVVNNYVAFDFILGRWVIVQPDGKNHEGRPVCVKNDGTVKAGLGKKNGLTIKELSYTGKAAEKHQALLNAMDMAANYHDAKCGQAFLKDYLAFVEHRVSFDALKGRWITVHPNGKDNEGRPVYVENDGTVKAGLGKKNGINIKELSDNGRTAKANQALQDAMYIAARYGHSAKAALALGADDFEDWLLTDDELLSFCPKLREQGFKMVEALRQNVLHINLDQLEVFKDSKPLRNYMGCMLAHSILQHIDHQRGLRSAELKILQNIKSTADELQTNIGKSMGLPLEAAISRLEGLTVQRELGGNKPPVYKPKGLVGAGECTPMSFKDSELNDVNPHNDKADGYKSNCQACVVACEMRCRGIDVEALPDGGLKDEWFVALSNRPQDIWVNPATKSPPDPIFIKNLVDLEALIQNGHRFVMYFRWKYGYGHIVTVTRQNRQLLIFDPQSGSKLSLVQFITKQESEMADGDIKVFRVDNCLILPVFAEHILIQANQAPIMEPKVSVGRKRFMDAEPIKAIQDLIRRRYPEDGSVTGYKFEPHYCGEYEDKLVFFLDIMPPKALPDSPMYVGHPLFALVDPQQPEKFEVLSDSDLKFSKMFRSKLLGDND